jgi:hypothetical protein
VIKSRRIRWAVNKARMGYTRYILVKRPKERRLFRRSGHRWENNIGMDLREMGTGCIWLRIGTSGGML